MPSEHDSDPTWHRLHPTTLLLRALTYARNFILPAIIVFFLAKDSEWEYWLLAAFIPAVLFEVFRYFTLRYRIAPGELIIKQGLIFRSERHIPFSRIQNIDIVQGPLHRALRVANVKVETASGAEPEAVLKVLSLDAVEEMRRRIFGESEGTGAADEAIAHETVPVEAPARSGRRPKVLLRLPVSELVILGLITVRGLALVAILLGVMWELDLWDRLDVRNRIEAVIEGGIEGPVGTIAIVVGILGIVVVLVLSILWTILRLYDFTLTQSGHDVQMTCGLLTRRVATIPRRRIQFITIRQSILHRLFSRVSVRVETAAGAGHGQKETEDRIMSQKWFIPIIRKDDLPGLLKEILPRLDLTGADWQPLAPRARRRMIRRNLIMAIIVSAAIAAILRPWGAAAILILVPFAVWHAVKSAEYMRYARAEFGILYRSGVITRLVSAAFTEKIQVVAMLQSPFDRRYRMASVLVDTAGAGPAGHKVDVPYLELDRAESLASDLYSAAQETRFRL